ncbi:MAG TPA: asparagine synthetase B family protein [Acidimicrobiales bacterium]|nr:asparagine synthetase B family protein [Acidimicrobiales bacterium]
MGGTGPTAVYANVVAAWHRDPAAGEAAAARLRARHGPALRPARDGWRVAVTPFHGRAEDEVVGAAGSTVVVEQPGGPSAADHPIWRARASPAELLAGAGDFGAVHLTGPGEVTVVRSCGGTVPLYLRATADEVVVATRLGDVAGATGSCEPDGLPLAILTTGAFVFPDGRTPLRGVQALPRGTRTVVTGGRLATERYWRPEEQEVRVPTAAEAAEHRVELREALLEHLDRTTPRRGALLAMSGGVDSTALAHLLARVVGGDLATLSLVPADPDGLAVEESFIDPVLHAVGVTRAHKKAMTAGEYLRLLEAAPRVGFPVIHPVLLALPEVLERWPVRALVGGEYADEVTGSWMTMSDWGRHARLRDLVATGFRGADRRTDLLRWSAHRALWHLRRPVAPLPAALPDIVHPELRREYADWRRAWRAGHVASGLPLHYLRMSGGVDGFVAQSWEACSHHGVIRTFPFFNRRVLELAHRCHPVERLGPGRKKLLRRALAGDVPAHNLHRADKGAFLYGGDVLGHGDPLATAAGPLLDAGWIERSYDPTVSFHAAWVQQLLSSLTSLGAAPSRGGG